MKTATWATAAILAAAILSCVAFGQPAATKPAATAPAAPVAALAAESPAATALIEVRRDPNSALAPWMEAPATIETFLTSSRVARKLYTDMRLYDQEKYQVVDSFGKFKDEIRQGLKVTFPSHSERGALVSLSLKWGHDKQSVDVLNMLIDAVREISDEGREYPVQRSVRVLSDRAADIDRKLNQTEKTIKTFQNDHGLAVDDPVTVKARYQRILADMETYRQKQTEAKALVDQLEALKKANSTDPGATIGLALAKAKADYEAATSTLDRLKSSRDEEAERAAQIAGDWEDLQGMMKQRNALEAIREDLARQVENVMTEYRTADSMLQVIDKAEVGPPHLEKKAIEGE